MGAILTLACKDIKLLMRDKFALFWIFAFPIMYALFFGALFSDGGGDGGRGAITIAIVDEDGGEEASGLIQRLADNEAISIEHEGEEESGPLRSHSLEDARDAVRKGRKVAYLRIPEGYGISPFALFGGGNAGAEDENAPALEVGIDPRRSAEAGLLQGVLMETVFGGISETFTDPAVMQGEIAELKADIAAADDVPTAQKVVLTTFMNALDKFMGEVDMQADGDGTGVAALDMNLVELVDVVRDDGQGPRSAFDITFPSAMIWGLMGVAITFAITLVRERTEGTLLRLQIAPISRVQLLAGKAFGCFATCMIVMAFIMGFGALALGVRFDNLPLAVISMAFTSLCFTGVMMTVSVMGKTEAAVGGAAWGAMMPFAMIGGGMIPLIAMPPWLLKLSDLSPFKWGIISMEGAVWRGFGLADMLLPWGVLLVVGLAFFGLGVWIFQKIDG